MGGTNLNFMEKIFMGASQTTTFSPSKVSRYTVPFQKDVCLTKWCDCNTSYLELNLAIALVIAESHYASGVIVALLLEGVIIIMELNMAVASLYYPLGCSFFLVVTLTIVVLGFYMYYYMSTAQGWGRGGWMVKTMWAGTDLYMNTNLLSQSSQLWGVLYMM